MLLAAHQPNFCPWLAYMDKINKADIFVLMVNCQFEKNGYQNRAEVFGKWWTMPVQSGLKNIKDKKYVNGERLTVVNEAWIRALCLTLGIDTAKLRYDFPTEARGTERIIELCKYYECDQYLTNPDAIEKYLNEKMMNDAGIEVIHHKFPHKIHTLEAFDQWGIEGTQKLLAKEKERSKCVT